MKADLLIIKFWIPLMAPCLGTVARIARRGGTRVVSVLDNIIPHEPHWWDSLLVRYFVGGIDKFVAMSDSVLRDCERFDRRAPKTLCPHPLYDNFGEPLRRDEACRLLGLDPKLTYLLFFGFIRDYKGLDLLMRAFADPRLAADKSLRLIVQPYKTATQSGVTQIAYHFSKPMLVTRVGGLAEIVPHGKVGYVCDVDEHSVADAIACFAQHKGDEAWHAALQQNIEKEKQKYAWSRMTAAITNL